MHSPSAARDRAREKAIFIKKNFLQLLLDSQSFELMILQQVTYTHTHASEHTLFYIEKNERTNKTMKNTHIYIHTSRFLTSFSHSILLRERYASAAHTSKKYIFHIEKEMLCRCRCHVWKCNYIVLIFYVIFSDILFDFRLADIFTKHQWSTFQIHTSMLVWLSQHSHLIVFLGQKFRFSTKQKEQKKKICNFSPGWKKV